MEAYKVTAEINLGKIIDETREIISALTEFVGALECIEAKYNNDEKDYEIIDLGDGCYEKVLKQKGDK